MLKSAGILALSIAIMPIAADAMAQDTAARGITTEAAMTSPDQLVGQYVTPLFGVGCFRGEGWPYVCTPSAPSLKGRILIVAPEIAESSFRSTIDKQCKSVSRLCPAKIRFKVESTEKDATGTLRILKTNMIEVDR